MQQTSATASHASPHEPPNFATAGLGRIMQAAKIFAAMTAEPEVQPHPDASTVAHCLEYASRMGSIDALYIVDPTDGDLARPVDDAVRLIADKALRAATKAKPTTLDGLHAKAMLIFTVTSDNVLDIGTLERDFLRSLASDVQRFQRADASRSLETGCQPPAAASTERPIMSGNDKIVDANIQPLAAELDLHEEISRLVAAGEVSALATMYEGYAQAADNLFALSHQPRAGAADDFMQADAERMMAKAYLIADQMQEMQPSSFTEEELCKTLFDCALRMGKSVAQAFTVAQAAHSRRVG